MLPVPFENVKIHTSDINPGDWFLPLGRDGLGQYELVGQALARGALGYSYEPNEVDPSVHPEALSLPTPSLANLLRSLADQKRRHCTGLFTVIFGPGKSTVKEMVGSIAAAWASFDTTRFFHVSQARSEFAHCTQILALPRHSSFALFDLSEMESIDFTLPPLSLLSPQIVALLREEPSEWLRSPSAEIFILPESSALLTQLPPQKKAISFGVNASAHFSARLTAPGKIEIQGEGQAVLLSLKAASNAGQTQDLRLQLAASAAIARVIGLPWSSVQAGLEKYCALALPFESSALPEKIFGTDSFSSLHQQDAMRHLGDLGPRPVL